MFCFGDNENLQRKSPSWIRGRCCTGAELRSSTAPSWMLQEVDDDFAAWGGQQFSTKQIDVLEMRYTDHLCRFTIRNFELHVGSTPACKSGFGSFHVQSIVDAVEELLGAEALPGDVDFFVDHDTSIERHAELQLDVPIFAHLALDCQKGMILLPPWDCIGGNTEHLLDQPENRNPVPPEDGRLLWRGNVRKYTKCISTPGETCACTHSGVAKNASQLKHFPRFRLAELSRRHPALIDAKGPCTKYCGDEAPAWALQQKLDYPVWAKYSFIAAVNGDAMYTTLAIWRPLLLGRILVRQVTNVNVPWFRHGLRPFQHYLPVREDLSDTVRQLRWAKSNLKETLRIATAGYRFGMKYVTRCRFYSLLHLKAAIIRYADLQHSDNFD